MFLYLHIFDGIKYIWKQHLIRKITLPVERYTSTTTQAQMLEPLRWLLRETLRILSGTQDYTKLANIFADKHFYDP